ncbi:DUF6515 family protein [Algibacter sp. L3A6]|uniref:DUF6515 family protein n=1 Tax=Algibacter sp. L3A6 TaxID=2686366 RepID=UPI00131B2343|nr:DUF6515 family protein [Algibacter sp. L3A6]
MKTILKTTIALLLVLGFSATSVAQNNKKNTKRTTVTKTVTKTTTKAKPISRSKVTYKTPTRKVVSVRSIPKSSVAIKHNGVSIYYTNNKFFRLNGGRYLPVVPTAGFQIRTLPVGYKRINFNNRSYFTHNGIYFTQVNNYYEVITPEIGTVVYELPDDVEKVTIDDARYYEFNNVLYEKVQIDGTRAYEVIGFIEN